MIRVDAHQHFWDPATGEYPWLTDERAAIRKRFGPAELQPNLDEHQLDGSVLVQARALLPETRDYLAVASGTTTILGVVGWVDLVSIDVADTLAELLDAPGGDRLVGIRHPVHDEPDPGWLERPDVLRGLRSVRDAGLAFDLLVRTAELPAAGAVVQEIEDMQFVIDHAAKPPFGELNTENWALWKRELAAVARYDNVSCKISGLVSETGGVTWPAQAFVPCVEHVLEVFGESRVLFGSDWPVCLLEATYDEVVHLAELLCEPMSLSARERFFGGNAQTIYQL